MANAPWLRALVAQKFPEIGQNSEPGYPNPWKSLLRRLLSLRLLQGTGVTAPDGQPLVARMHRLVQDQVADLSAASEEAGEA